jgi:hypothetical protein
VTPAGRAPRRALTALAVVLAMAAVGLAVMLAGCGRPGGGAAPGRAPAAPVTAPGASAPQLPQVSLAGLRWGDYHGVRLPSSAAAGPRETNGGLASGYADSPLGALPAALNIAVRANAQWGPGIFGPTIRDQVTGPDAAALLAGCQSAYAQASQGVTVRAVTQVQVTWDGADWKVIAPPGGDWRNSAAQLASLAGYTIFPGQG